MRPFSYHHGTLIDRLVAARTAAPMLERMCADPRRDVFFDRSDWVSVYADAANTVRRDQGRLTATRAITLQGRMIWLVRARAFKRAYHSRAGTAEAAFRDAETAWSRRAAMRVHRDELQRVVRDLRFGRVRYPITVDDAYASPLCEEGVDGFLRSFGLGRFRTFPGWFIAWAFALDRQVGFVIWEAHLRQAGPAHGEEAARGS
ncbi:hypothetical protein [Ovoidimarina sediminis]|uniref:hypothetical protein n=1 Tax=Ovoidimarina sediminis TaxID=3079856 RepID=UPI00291567F5|nr:hypothetical protein [Rhodophyticola sp. MJ-SS7]MDU8941979.1 hypothetical protein [Rhodophyticola sp. MJ-SS7]